MTSPSESKVPCDKCGALDWCIIDLGNGCDKCNPQLDMDRLVKMFECKHEHRTESRIVGCTNCLDCGMAGIELIEALG